MYLVPRLQERRDLLDNAPHLTRTLPILMPCYKWWEVPFYWAGLKAYDLIAGTRNLAWSKYLPPSESTRRLPTLAETNHAGKSLKGTVSSFNCLRTGQDGKAIRVGHCALHAHASCCVLFKSNALLAGTLQRQQ